jgi:inhibitor of Bruton tyrosine kinase
MTVHVSDIQQNHLLLDNLTDICSANILRFVDLQNVSSVLVDAQHFNATALVKSLHGYMTENLETLMEMHALDELPRDVLKSFSIFLRNKQAEYHPKMRLGANIIDLERKWANWLRLQDFPTCFVPKYLLPNSKSNLIPASHSMSHNARIAEVTSPGTSRPQDIARSDHNHGDDDIFPMDGDVSTGKYPASTTPTSNLQHSSPTVPRGWKSSGLSDRVDMRAIMEAEKQASDAKRQQILGSSPSTNAPLTNWTARPLKGPKNPRQNHPVGTASRSPPLRTATPITTSGISSSPLRSSPSKRHLTATSDTNNSASKSSLPHRQMTSAIPSDTRAISNTSMTHAGISNNPKQANDKPVPGANRHLGPLIVPVKISPRASLPVRHSASE